ncbi:MAG: DUF1315 family protein [Alteromonadaceae bacterium]|nr:DUF1315 family protein [Alteromonadaceae bacterium]
MDLLHLVDNMSDEMYQRLKSAAETGKWPEGTVVDKEQQASALQIIMAYQSRNLNADEMMTIGTDGHLVNKTKRELKQQFSSSVSALPETKVLSDTSFNNKNNIARFSDL